LYGYVRDNPVNLVDPLGLLTIFYGFDASAFWGEKGSATAELGAIAYSDQTRLFGGNYFTHGRQKSPCDGTWTALGGGAGIGPSAGFLTGSLDAFEGTSFNLTFVFVFVSITYTENSCAWGLSFSAGGKGAGLGYYMNQTTTEVTGKRPRPVIKPVPPFTRPMPPWEPN
jgi:hypothetical protein